jgi:cytochrome c2
MPSYQPPPDGHRDIVAYMQEELRDFDEAPAPTDGQEPAGGGRAAEGGQVFVKYGCRTCHARRDTQHEEFGPDLGAIGDSRSASVDFGARSDLPRAIPAWLRAKITEPRSFGPDSKMPSFALSDADASDMITALMAFSRERVPPLYERSASRPSSAPPPSGEVGRLFTRYRCLACHFVGEVGTDLSTAPLTFQGSKTKQEWLARYLVLPDTIYPLLTERMPVLGITRREAEQMAAYISAVYVDDAIGARESRHGAPSLAAVSDGARLFEERGCRSCHILGATGGYVGPPLTGAGDRLQRGWIAYWLERPQQWRPQARCPNYGLTQDEIDALTAFLSTRHAATMP